MSFQDCIDEIQAAAGRALSDEELDRIASRLDRAIKSRRKAAKAASLADELLAEGRAEAGAALDEARIARRNTALNIMARDRIKAQIARFADPAEGLQAVLVGVVRGTPDARRSIDARSKALEREFLGGLLSDLRRDDLLPLVRAGALDDDIAREMWQIRANTPEGGQPGITKNPEARQIAKIFARHKEHSRRLQNKAGAFIGKMDGHIHQSHAMAKVRTAGFEAWAGEILPRLDTARTFAGADQLEFLRRVFDDIATGEHIGGVVARGEASGPANLARKVSKPRVLHFKSADDWLAYDHKFGIGTLAEGVFHGLDKAARDTALMEVLGPNPRVMFEALRKNLKDAHRDDLKTFDRLNSGKFENFYREVSGEANIPGNLVAAQWGRGIRAVQSMAKLGGAALSSIADVGAVAVNARYRGENFLSGYGAALQSVFRGRGSGEVRELADDLGVGIDGMIGAVVSRFSAEDDLPGTMSKLLNGYFRINGLSWWTDAQKTGAALMASSSLGKKSSLDWAGLPVRLRNVLSQHGIDDAEWSIIRGGVQEVEGRTFITPEAVNALPLESMDPGIGDRIAALANRGHATPDRLARLRTDARRELATRLRSYFVEEADFAVPTPGARERAILRQGTRPGTAAGEALRFLMQFKSFPITVAAKVVGRGIRGAPGGKADIAGLAQIVVGMTAMGYLAMTAKDLAKGRTPRDPFDPRTWSAAFLQGGGAGIYGDFLFGEFNRFGQSALDTAAGPTFGTASDILGLLAKIRAGDPAAAQAFRLALSNTPYVNLFYTREAFNYLIAYQVQEALNPGYLRRMERRVKKQNRQTFLLPPSKIIPRGGGAPRLDRLSP